jgi:hypothetical protein
MSLENLIAKGGTCSAGLKGYKERLGSLQRGIRQTASKFTQFPGHAIVRKTAQFTLSAFFERFIGQTTRALTLDTTSRTEAHNSVMSLESFIAKGGTRSAGLKGYKETPRLAHNFQGMRCAENCSVQAERIFQAQPLNLFLSTWVSHFK